jgi:hypothetical protein
VALVMFDYTCPHCRSLHGYLREAIARYGDALAVVLAPVPLDKDCNRVIERTQPLHEHACKYARLAMAVWVTDPKAFTTFDDWLSNAITLPSPENARSFAARLIGKDSLDQAMKKPMVDERIQESVSLYDFVGRGPIPKIITENNQIIESPSDRPSFFEALENTLHIKPIGTDAPR